MAELPPPSELKDALNISQSYASMIRTGARIPPRTLAIRIFRQFGVKLGDIANLTDREIDQLEKLEAKAA